MFQILWWCLLLVLVLIILNLLVLNDLDTILADVSNRVHWRLAPQDPSRRLGLDGLIPLPG